MRRIRYTLVPKTAKIDTGEQSREPSQSSQPNFAARKEGTARFG